MYERIAPDAPISEPTTVNKSLFNMKPSAHRAQPEYEFNTVMATGLRAQHCDRYRVVRMSFNGCKYETVCVYVCVCVCVCGEREREVYMSVYVCMLRRGDFSCQ